MTAINFSSLIRHTICVVLAALTVSTGLTLGVVTANNAVSDAERSEVIVEVA
jgi:hypothetical protein